MLKKLIIFGLACLAVSGCEGTTRGQNLAQDEGFDRKNLQALQAGIWVDPNGCQHWIIDDGVEGYMSQRLQPDGKPVCDNILPTRTIVGNYKAGSGVADVF